MVQICTVYCIDRILLKIQTSAPDDDCTVQVLYSTIILAQAKLLNWSYSDIIRKKTVTHLMSLDVQYLLLRRWNRFYLYCDGVSLK
jgi:hypothetical protein